MRQQNNPLERESKAASIPIYQNLQNHPRAAQEIAEALGQPFSPQAAHIAALVITQALTQTRKGLSPAPKMVIKHWERIIDPQCRERFRPIIPLALRLLRALPPGTAKRAVREMTKVSELAPDPAGTGMIVQKLAHQRKHLAVYHTRPGAAALVARLAVPGDLDWADPGTVTQYRIADYSCGTGDLLTSAYRRVRELHQQAGGSPEEVHAAVMEHAVTAVDVLPASVALAAAGLDALERSPAQPGGATRALTLRYGPIKHGLNPNMNPGINSVPQERRPVSLGSLDLLDPQALRNHDLRPIGRGNAAQKRLEFPSGSQDLVIMNPPFTQSPDPRVLDQNIPSPERGFSPTSQAELARMENRMENIQDRIKAGSANGLSLHFAHLADRMVKRGGTIALVLPMSALTAGGGAGEARGSRRPDLGWPVFRRKLLSGYADIRIIGIAGFEEQDSTFSHDTHIAEVAIIARRTQVNEKPDGTGCFINLKRRPEDEQAAAGLSQAINQAVRQLQTDPLGTVRELVIDGLAAGNAVRDALPKDDIWPLSRVMDPGLMQAVAALKKGKLHAGGPQGPGIEPGIDLPMAALGDITRIGPAGHEAESLLGTPINPESGPGEHGFPMLKGHDCASQRTLEIPQAPEFHLKPGMESREGRLTGTMSRLHVNDNFRYNSQSTAALMTPEPSVGGRGWPNVRVGEERQERALAVWLNTSLGLITHWGMSNHTQNGLGYTSRKQIKNLPVLDAARLSHRQLAMMSETFNQVKDLPMLPANEAWRDQIRAELDRRVLEDILRLGEEATSRPVAVQPLVFGAHGAGPEGAGGEAAAGHGGTGRAGRGRSPNDPPDLAGATPEGRKPDSGANVRKRKT